MSPRIHPITYLKLLSTVITVTWHEWPLPLILLDSYARTTKCFFLLSWKNLCRRWKWNYFLWIFHHDSYYYYYYYGCCYNYILGRNGMGMSLVSERNPFLSLDFSMQVHLWSISWREKYTLQKREYSKVSIMPLWCACKGLVGLLRAKVLAMINRS